MFGAFTIAFQVNFVVMTLAMVAYMVRYRQLYYQKLYGTKSTGFLLKVYIIGMSCAGLFWITDFALCSIMHGLPLNPQFHAWWHVLVGYSGHNSLMYEITMRLTYNYKKEIRVEGLVLFNPKLTHII
jgi:dihydroceramidase